jgi:hypothetical protein
MTRRENLHSIRGEPPTEFESQLFAAFDQGNPISPWTMIGRRIGLPAMCVVFDELGGENVYVPIRAAFFERLATEKRDARIVELLADGAMSQIAIAEHFGLTKARICQIAAAVKRSARP